MEKRKPLSNSNWVDPDDAPAWTPELFGRAEIREGDKLVREATGTVAKRGRPKLENPKQQVTLRLDADVLNRFRAAGPGWQSRINDALRKAAGIR